jgi:hypothetical protein
MSKRTVQVGKLTGDPGCCCCNIKTSSSTECACPTLESGGNERGNSPGLEVRMARANELGTWGQELETASCETAHRAPLVKEEWEQEKRRDPLASKEENCSSLTHENRALSRSPVTGAVVTCLYARENAERTSTWARTTTGEGVAWSNVA